MVAMDWKRAIWGLVVGVAALTVATPARAQLADSVYADAKDIIEELLTTEIAHEVAPGIACLSGRRGANPGDDGATTYHFEGTVDGKTATIDRTIRLEATAHFPKTLQSVFNRQFGRLKTTIRDESANLAGYLAYQALHAAAVDAKAAGRPKILALATAQLEKAVADCPTDPDDPAQTCQAKEESAQDKPQIVFGAMGSNELSACKDAVKVELDDGEHGQRSSYPLDDECKSSDTSSFECHVAYAVRSGILNLPAPTQDHLTKATALLIREVAKATHPGSERKALDALEHKVLFLLRKALAEDTWEEKPLDGVAAGVAPPDLLARLEEIHATWRSAVNAESGKIDVLAFFRSVAAADGTLAGFCKGQDTAACRVLAKLSLVSKPETTDDLSKLMRALKPVLMYSARGEYSEAAQLAIGYVFQRIGSSNSVDVSIHQRFVQSVAAYVLDAADGQAPSETARVAFRKASVEMIQYLGQGSGIRRRYSSAWSAFKIALLPDLALRASWSGSYVNEGAGASRILASANWLNLRVRIRRTEATYLGFELSLIDPLAPLSELALRKKVQHYRDQQKLFFNVFTPRVELLAASPMLSEHLGVSAGLSLRMSAAIADDSSETRFHYAPFNKAKDSDGKLRWPNFLEFGFAAKYLL